MNTIKKGGSGAAWKNVKPGFLSSYLCYDSYKKVAIDLLLNYKKKKTHINYSPKLKKKKEETDAF